MSIHCGKILSLIPRSRSSAKAKVKYHIFFLKNSRFREISVLRTHLVFGCVLFYSVLFPQFYCLCVILKIFIPSATRIGKKYRPRSACTD